ncbi:MAG TPA: hypothetical protein VFJ30_15370, partial [Phycisphaerae bacterium]|nr:hypothetical protein [Phycisphaerae bacterium]
AVDGVVRFRVNGRTPIEKPLDEIAVIEMADDPRLTAAEKTAGEGKIKEAIPGYRDALGAATLGWKRTLIRYRLMKAAETGGKIDLAVATWLEIVDAAAGAPAAVASRPRKLPARGDAGNAKAIAALEAKASLVKQEQYLRTVLRLLADLYEREGRLKDAQAVIERLSGETASTASSTGQEPASAPSAGADQVRLARLAWKAGDFGRVVAELKPKLRVLGAADLPEALYLLGKVQSALAGKAEDAKVARDLRIEAGLNLMRVVALFGGDENVPDAMLEAGRINHALGNDVAARATWGEVTTLYKNSPAAQQASKALAELDGK